MYDFQKITIVQVDYMALPVNTFSSACAPGTTQALQTKIRMAYNIQMGEAYDHGYRHITISLRIFWSKIA